MDFTPELMAFQGVLTSANKKHPFESIRSRGGKEDEIGHITESLHKYFLDKHFLTAEGIPDKHKLEMQKFCFYIILNSDFKTLDEIIDYPNLGHLVWTTPTVTVPLFCEIIWALHMEDCIREVIININPKLSVEILKVLVNGVRYCSAQDSINKVKALALASYCSLCRISFFNYDSIATGSIVTELYTCFLRSITHFVAPPNAGALEQLPEDDQYVHLGKSFHSLLEVTLNCLHAFESPLQFDSKEFEIFLSTVNPETVKLKDLQSVEANSELNIKEYLEKCNIAALDKCVEVVMKISVDVFCSWSEYSDNSQSLQRSIGEMCHHLHEKLLKMDALSEHTVVSMLPQLSCKPITVFDLIRDADDDTVITNAAANHPDREHWLTALVERTNLFEREALMMSLLANIAYIKAETCEHLFIRCISFLQCNKFQNENAKMIATQSFSRINAEKKCDLLCEVFSDKILHDYLEEPDFNDKMNEIFNKFISAEESTLTEIFDLFLQNPREVYEKILHVGVENIKQANLMVEAIVMLKSFSEHQCDGLKEPALLNAIEELCALALDTETQENSFILLISQVCKQIETLRRPLLIRTIMPYVHKSVVSTDFRTLKLYLKLLVESYDVEQLYPYRPPVLAMLGQAFTVARWTFTSFSPDAPDTLQQAIDVQTKLISSYDGDIPERDTNWLKSKLKNLKPLNMYYFRDVWKAPGNNFIQVITNDQKIGREEFPVLLAKVLNSCTLKEWSLVWKSLSENGGNIDTLDLIYEALVIMTSAEIKNRTSNSWACIQYCYRCFTCTVKEQLLDGEINEPEITKVLEKLVNLINIITDDDIGVTGSILLPLFAIAANKQITSGGITHAEIVNKLNNGTFAKLVENVLSQTAS